LYTIFEEKNMTSALLFITDDLPISEAHSRYARRRQVLKSLCKVPTVIFSVDQGPGGKNPWSYAYSAIYQEPLFLFLTGLTQYPSALLLLPGEDDILFLPPKDSKAEFWDGAKLGVGSESAEKEARDLSGFSQILPLALLADTVSAFSFDQIGLYFHRSTEGALIEDSNVLQNKALSDKLSPTPEIINISPAVWATRFPYDDVDRHALETAIKISTQALKKTIPILPHCATEYEVAGTLNGEVLKQTPFGLSFPTILASGKNAATLHYTQNDALLDKSAMVLIDFGARWQSQHADISRTVPANGTFSPMQAILYQIVLDTQKTVSANVKAGVTFEHLNTLCWATLRELLDTRFIAKGGKAILPYAQQPHNVGHLLGIQVHDGDPFRDYKTQPLQAGMVITNEPGLYGEFEIELDGIHYHEQLGIRIEDDLWITETGHLNLSAACPKTITEIEALFKQG